MGKKCDIFSSTKSSVLLPLLWYPFHIYHGSTITMICTERDKYIARTLIFVLLKLYFSIPIY